MKKKYLLSILIVCLLLVGCSKNRTNDKEKESDSEPNITEQVIYDKDDVKVIVKSIDYDGYIGPSIKFYAENNSDKDIVVQYDFIMINDLVIDEIFSLDVLAGKKANDKAFISKEALEVSKIEIIKDIEFNLEIIDMEAWDAIDIKKGIKISTDATSYIQTYEPEGELVLDEYGLKVYAERVEDDDFFEKVVYFYIENNSDVDMSILTKDVSVNGYMTDAAFSLDIPSGKKGYTTVGFYEEDLDENNIISIDEIELKFELLKMNTWDTLYETSKFKAVFNK